MAIGLALIVHTSPALAVSNLQNRVMFPAEAPFAPAYGLNVFGFWRVDTPGHMGGDYNQRASERALARQRR